MLVKIEYRQEIHKINLQNIKDLKELEQTARKLYAFLPRQFCFLINDSEGTIVDNNELSKLKKSNLSSVKLKIKSVQSNQSDLISVPSDNDNSFIKLQESNISQGPSERQSIQIIYQSSKPSEWRRDGSIFITSMRKQVQTFKEETTQFFKVETSSVVKVLPSKKQQRESMVIIHREEEEIDQLMQKLKQVGLKEHKEEEEKQENLIKEEIIENQVIFNNIQCDICYEYPIKGPVFKCLVCEEFDICQNCEAVFHHFHPTLIMTKPSHYPTSIKVMMPQPSKRVKDLLLEQKQLIKQHKRRQMGHEKNENVREIDPSTLKSTVVKAPSFVGSLLGVRCPN